jgi:1,2-diacylglycerol 3-alpha-glucosyltransferase
MIGRAPAPSSVSATRILNVAMVCDGIGDVVGGSFISTLRFAELLKERGHRVVFISSGSRKHPRNHEFRGMKTYRLFGVLIPWSEGQLHLAIPWANRLRAILRDERIDLVHVMIPMPLGLVAVRVAKAMGLPVVMHSHTQPENIFMNAPHFPGRDALHRRFCAYLNWIYRQSDAMIYPSAFSRRQFPELSMLTNKVISNGVNRHRFCPTSPDAFMHKFNLPCAKQRLMYLGRLHREKNVETLIRAMSILLAHRPHTHLFIVGFGYEQPALERLARERGVAAHVTFCGFVPDEDLAAAYSACDLFVLPSLAELEGMAVLEAMSCGKPILIADSKDSAATDFVEGNGLLFRAGDAEHLAAQATRLLSDPERLRAMGQVSVTKSRSFDITESVAAIESLYYSLLPTP